MTNTRWAIIVGIGGFASGLMALVNPMIPVVMMGLAGCVVVYLEFRDACPPENDMIRSDIDQIPKDE